MNIRSIDFLKDVKIFNPINDGFSGAYKYKFKKKGKNYFLKIGKLNVQENLEEILNKCGISHPKIIESGKFNKEYYYIIEEFIKGSTLKCNLDNLDIKSIYEYAFKIGKQYGNLRILFPDKPISKTNLENHFNNVQEKLNQLKELVINSDKLNEKQIKFINYAENYLKSNITLIKNSKLIFGHTDIKPSNFFINKNEIIAIDIEHTDYKELSLSMIWSYARTDYNDNKNFAFTVGYIYGLFNHNVPKNILKVFNYNYLFNIVNIIIEYIKKERYDKLDKLLDYIINNFIKNNEIQISEKLYKTLNECKKYIDKDKEIKWLN